MMAERSKVTKGKKKDRERMRKVRGTDKKAVANEEAVGTQERLVNFVKSKI